MWPKIMHSGPFWSYWDLDMRYKTMRFVRVSDWYPIVVGLPMNPVKKHLMDGKTKKSLRIYVQK